MRVEDPTWDAPLRRGEDRLGPARLVRHLGSGSFGTVYEAVLECDTAYAPAGTRVAVKVLHAGLARDPLALVRFEREVDLGASISHPGLARVFERGVALEAEPPQHYLVEEFVDGSTLTSMLEAGGAIPEPLLRELARQVASALAALHARGVVHRDIKPSNIVLTPGGQVKLLDLGVALLADDDGRSAEPPGRVVGTLRHAAPEQFGDGDVGAAADLHALGTVLYEAATGRPLYGQDTPAAIVRAQLLHEAPLLGDAGADVSPWFEDLVAWLLVKDPAERLKDASLLARLLEEGNDAPLELRARTPRRRGLSRRSARGAIDLPFSGREAVMQRLDDAAEAAFAGAGRIVALVARAGLGKSRVIDELLLRLVARHGGIRILRGAFSSTDPRGDLGPLADAIRGAFGPGLGARVMREALSATPELADVVVPLLTASVSCRNPPSHRLTMEALESVIWDLARGLARTGPTAWLLEDIHEAGDVGRRLVGCLARAVRGRPALVVVAARNDCAWLRSDAVIEIEPLTDEVMTSCVERALGCSALARDVAEAVSAVAGGSPYEASAAIGLLRARRVLEPDATGVWRARGTWQEVALAADARGRTLARLGCLGGADRGLLELAAAAGSPFDAALVAGAAGKTLAQVLDAMARIGRMTGLVRTMQQQLMFEHDLVRASILGALGEEERTHLHASLLDAFLELHGSEGGPVGESLVSGMRQAVRVGRRDLLRGRLMDAVAWLADAGRNEEAVALCNDARDVLDPAEDVHLRARLGLARCIRASIGNVVGRAVQEEWIGHAIHEMEMAGDASGVRRGRLHRARLAAKSASSCDAASELDAILADARAARDEDTELEIRCLQEDALSPAGNVAGMLDLYAPLASRAEAGGNCRLAASAQVRVAEALLYMGRFDEARSASERAVDLAWRAENHEQIIYALASLGGAHHRMGAWAEARTCFEQALDRARHSGATTARKVALNGLGILLRDMGDIAGARECQELGLEIARARGNASGEAIALVNLGAVLLDEGRREEARRCWQDCLALTEAGGFDRVGAYALEGLGCLTMEDGLLEEGIALHRRAIDARRRLGLLPALHGSLVGLGISLLSLNRRDEALPLFREALEICRMTGEPSSIAEAGLAVLGEIDPHSVRVSGELSIGDQVSAHMLLWRASGDRGHLVRVREIYELCVAHLGEDDRRRALRTHPTALMLARAEAEADATPGG